MNASVKTYFDKLSVLVLLGLIRAFKVSTMLSWNLDPKCGCTILHDKLSHYLGCTEGDNTDVARQKLASGIIASVG